MFSRVITTDASIRPRDGRAAAIHVNQRWSRQILEHGLATEPSDHLGFDLPSGSVQ